MSYIVEEPVEVPTGGMGARHWVSIAPRVMHRGGHPLGQRPVAGLGNWRQDVAQLVAGKELDQLMTAVRHLNDQISATMEVRNQILEAYANAEAIETETRGLPAGDPSKEPAQMALGVARQGVYQLARQITTLVMFNGIFGSISAALTSAGLNTDANAVDETLTILRKFVAETDNMFQGIAAYTSTKANINNAAKTEWAAWGVASYAPDDPRWLAAWVKSTDRIVPVPDKPEIPDELKAAGLGNPLLPAVVAIIYVVAIVAAAVVAMYGIKKLCDTWNAKAVTARELVLQRARELSDKISEMQEAGASQAEIDAFVKSWNASTKEQVGNIPEGPSLLGTVLPIVGIALGIGVIAKTAGVI